MPLSGSSQIVKVSGLFNNGLIFPPTASSIHQLVGEELRQGSMDIVEVSREEVKNLVLSLIL